MAKRFGSGLRSGQEGLSPRGLSLSRTADSDGLLRQGAKNRDMYLRYVSRFFIRARSARKLPWKERGHALKGPVKAL
jgi:hypothetical protein